MSQRQFKLKIPCPKCAKSSSDYHLETWYHDGHCGGALYIDENAIVHCTKCGKSAHISKMYLTCDCYRHREVRVYREELAAAIAVGHIGVDYDSPYWFKRILDNL